MPVETAAAHTLVTQWGAAGVIIIGLAGALIAMFKFFQAQLAKMMADEKAERAEMRQVHAAERAEMQRANQQNFDQSLAVSKENTASNRAVEQVIRELTGQLGGIKEWAKSRQNGG